MASERVHEGDERVGISVSNDATEDLARADVESSQQRAGPATSILELVANDAAVADVGRMPARQRLHRLLVHAQDDGILGRMGVETADASDLGAKLGVLRVQPVAHTMRSQATGAEHAPDRAAANELAGTTEKSPCDCFVRPHAPKRCDVLPRDFLRTLARKLYDLASGHERDSPRAPASRRVEQRLDARLRIPARPPLAHDSITAAAKSSHSRRAVTVRQPHDHPGANDDIVCGMPSPRERLQPRPFRSRNANSTRLRTWTHAASIHELRVLFPCHRDPERTSGRSY